LKKKILMLVAALALTAGIGFGVSKVSDQAGNPPIGGFTDTTTQVADGFTTMGNPPIGG
jgi:ABC-type glucose/galactose transport system permease subunit